MPVHSRNEFTIEDFFKTMIPSENPEDRAIEYLKARGFLIDNNEGRWLVSDNSHPDDANDLDQILQEYELGEVAGDEIVITNPENAEQLRKLFTGQKSFQLCMSYDSFRGSIDYFCSRVYGLKVPVMKMDPFVARYIKAISACGLITETSCDGNDHAGRKFYIGLAGKPNTFWHQVLWNRFLSRKFDVRWDRNGKEFSTWISGKFRQYTEINRAAEFLYENRVRMRELKQNNRDFVREVVRIDSEE